MGELLHRLNNALRP